MRSDRTDGWLFLSPDAVPDRWRDRVVPAAMIPLLPGETHQILAGRAAVAELTPDDQDLARMVARARTGSEIARELGIPRRTVDRRLARLRERFGVATTAELGVLLAGAGFSAGGLDETDLAAVRRPMAKESPRGRANSEGSD